MEGHTLENTPELLKFASAPWSLFLGQAGKWLIISATIFFVCSFLLQCLAGKRPKLGKIGVYTFTTGILMLFVAFGFLATLMMTRQYQYKYVFGHTDNLLGFGYRVAALWSGQEGSFLLWSVTSGIMALLFGRSTGEYRRWFTAVYALFLGALAGIMIYESPFNLINQKDIFGFDPGQILTPPDGNGMTPALINYWMQIHPPTIFMGFGTLSALFAWSMAALISGDMDSWAKKVRPLALVSMTLLGIGLIMGGFWAYETLGWGGFWMWDPVENASLIPFLLVTTFIHGLFVQVARNKWQVGNAIFGAAGFLSFCYGTFLTRSGFLGDQSVHSFAKMDRYALNLLIGIGVVATSSLIIAAIYRASKLKTEPRIINLKSKLNLENAYGFGMTMLTAMAIASAIGMSVPLIQSLRGQQPKMVEEELYNRIVTWFFLPTLVLMATAPYLSWRGLPLKDVVRKLGNVLALTMGFIGIGLILWMRVPAELALENTATVAFIRPDIRIPTFPWIVFLAGLCLFGIIANIYRFVEHWRSAKTSAGSLLTHTGVIVVMLGLIVSRGLQKKVQFDVQQGRPGMALGYNVVLEGQDSQLNKRENRMQFRFTNTKETFLAKPVLFYTERSGEPEPQATVRPWIKHSLLNDTYVTVFPMVFEATEETEFKPGDQRRFGDYVLTYKKMERIGEAGVKGTKFLANLEISGPAGVQVLKPSITIGDGLKKQPMQLGDDYYVYFQGMDVATQTARIQLYYVNPIFPLELYYKPMPGLVWWGAGIMTVGGFLAAWNRRPRRGSDSSPESDPDKKENPDSSKNLEPETEIKEIEDATVATA